MVINLSQNDISKLETQVFWSSVFGADVLKRIETLDPITRDLYEVIFHRRKVEFSFPNPPFQNEVNNQNNYLLASEGDVELSIVVPTRNDLHSDRMLERTQSFIDGIYHLAEHFERRLELIIVEWNPPTERPPLREEYKFPNSSAYVSTVIITVGSSIHAKYKMANSLKLYQMIAKNVGIRRARGKFILATNIDVLFSPQLFLEMTSPTLEKGKLYRSHRADICSDVLDLSSAEEIINQADKNILRIHYPEGPSTPDTPRTTKKNFYGNVEPNDTEFEFSKSTAKIAVEGTRAVFIGWDGLPHLHYQQCGDFQLMHRDDWKLMRGYMELDSFIFHLDSLLSITCFHNDIEEHVFGEKCMHYHLDHKTSEEFQPGISRTSKGNLIHHLSIFELWGMERAMSQRQQSYVYNDERWGCAADQLAIETVTVAEWDNVKCAYEALDLEAGKSCYVDLVQSNDAVARENVSTALGQSYKNYEQRWIEEVIQDLRKGYQILFRYLSDHFPQEKIWIWGAGNRGSYMLHQFQKANINPRGFISSNATAKDRFHGFDVHPPQALDFAAGDKVVVSSMFASEVYETLVNMGAIEGKDFLVAP